jgi:hypothetical protein
VANGRRKMFIQLERALVPECVNEVLDCALCGQGFETGIVAARAFAEPGLGLPDDPTNLGEVCQACLLYLDTVNPEKFPYSEFEAREAEWTTPVYLSSEEFCRAIGW